MANNAGTAGKRRGFRPPRTEDDAMNPQTKRPYWDESAPNLKDPGRSDSAPANHIMDAYVSQQNRKQRKLIGRA